MRRTTLPRPGQTSAAVPSPPCRRETPLGTCVSPALMCSLRYKCTDVIVHHDGFWQVSVSVTTVQIEEEDLPQRSPAPPQPTPAPPPEAVTADPVAREETLGAQNVACPESRRVCVLSIWLLPLGLPTLRYTRVVGLGRDSVFFLSSIAWRGCTAGLQFQIGPKFHKRAPCTEKSDCLWVKF